MKELVQSFTDIAWDTTKKGVRAKTIEIGAKIIRLLEFTDGLEHPEWCVKGHTGYVVEGSFVLNINGSETCLNQGDVFVVADNEPSQRHIPIVPKDGLVLLLLIEES